MPALAALHKSEEGASCTPGEVPGSNAAGQLAPSKANQHIAADARFRFAVRTGYLASASS
jgi:hypothetical protein